MRRTLRPALALLLVLAGYLPGQAQAFVMPPPMVAAPDPGGLRVTDSGLVANFYRGAGTHGAILLLGGSEGGISPGTARQARDLVTHGFAVLQLGYFGAPGLPSRLNRVPLEYFERALAWLARQRGVRAIAIVGASKGAEAALLVASRHPELKAVVLGMPSAAVWQGIDFSGGPTSSSWSVGGKPLHYLAFAPPQGSPMAVYAGALPGFTQRSPAAIPVARVKAPLLMVCGESDALWPSCPMAQMVAAEMHAHGLTAQVLSYRDAGHGVFGPPADPASPAFNTLGALGGTPAGVNAARLDAWPKVVAFLSAHLRP